MKSNTKTLLAIGVVLLVITIGVSFSYFVSKTTQNKLEDVNTEAPTAKIPEFTLETKVDTPESLPMYPGTKNYISASVKGIKEGGEDTDTTEYQIKYKITGSVEIPEGIEFTQGEVTYKLYKTTEEIKEPEKVITCEDVTGTQGEDDKQTEVHYSQECTLNEKLTNAVTLKDDINNGSIQSGTAEFTYEDVIPADNKTIHYYYLVVEYPETNDDQSLDMGKSVTYAINSIVSTETGIKEPTASEKTLNQLASLNNTLKSNGPTATFTGTSCISGTNGTNKNQAGVEGNCDVEENGIYEAEDDDGISYYFRGTVENNYVKFGKIKKEIWTAGYENYYNTHQECLNSYDEEECIAFQSPGDDIWWRIIRINGDGSIRMIYAGTSNDNNAHQIGRLGIVIEVVSDGRVSKFNNFSNYNEYVGFQYQTGVRKGHEDKSIALIELEEWFEENLLDEFQAENSKIDTNAGFCGDRSSYDYDNYTLDNTLGIGDKYTAYGSCVRNRPNGHHIGNSNPGKPSYVCLDKANDLYTYTESTKGTQSLKYPIGLITADEAVYAGATTTQKNYGYYLGGFDSWTISPSYYTIGDDARVFRLASDYIQEGRTNDGNDIGFLPVINLKPGSLISGSGTTTDPFKTVNE